jgi:hypothetical protein
LLLQSDKCDQVIARQGVAAVVVVGRGGVAVGVIERIRKQRVQLAQQIDVVGGQLVNSKSVGHGQAGVGMGP